MAAKQQSQQLQTVLLAQKGDIKQTKLPSKDITFEAIKKLLKSKHDVELLGTYEYQTYQLYLFGAIDGKEGTENEHELPPPHDSILAFGDILVIASQTNNYMNPVPFTSANFEKFYQYILEGLDEDDEDAEEEDGVDDAEEGILDEENDDAIELEGGGDELEEDDMVEHVEEEHRPIPKKKAISKSKQPSILLSPDFKELTDTNNEDPNHKRSLVRGIIKNLLSSLNSDELEMAIYKASLKEAEKKNIIPHWKNSLFETNYMILSRKIIGNLNDASYVKNTRLIQRLQDGEFTYEELALKNYYELFPESWKELSDRLIMREQRLLEGNKGMATDQFKCHGCGKRECTYYEMQTRSADEPMTIFITCLNCGKRWRQ
jgi:transcription elongation factor S-II